MALFIRMPVDGDRNREPNSDSSVCVSVTMLPSRSTTEICVVEPLRRGARGIAHGGEALRPGILQARRNGGERPRVERLAVARPGPAPRQSVECVDAWSGPPVRPGSTWIVRCRCATVRGVTRARLHGVEIALRMHAAGGAHVVDAAHARSVRGRKRPAHRSRSSAACAQAPGSAAAAPDWPRPRAAAPAARRRTGTRRPQPGSRAKLREGARDDQRRMPVDHQAFGRLPGGRLDQFAPGFTPERLVGRRHAGDQRRRHDRLGADAGCGRP